MTGQDGTGQVWTAQNITEERRGVNGKTRQNRIAKRREGKIEMGGEMKRKSNN